MDDMPHMALLGTSLRRHDRRRQRQHRLRLHDGSQVERQRLGVYCRLHQASQDDPKQETIAELLRRKTNMAIGVVSDAEIEDATPASVVSHTRRRANKADIVGMFYNVKPEVILGGGPPTSSRRKPPAPSARTASTTSRSSGDAGTRLRHGSHGNAQRRLRPDARAPASASFTPATWTAGSTATSGRGNTVKKFLEPA